MRWKGQVKTSQWEEICSTRPFQPPQKKWNQRKLTKKKKKNSQNKITDVKDSSGFKILIIFEPMWGPCALAGQNLPEGRTAFIDQCLGSSQLVYSHVWTGRGFWSPRHTCERASRAKATESVGKKATTTLGASVSFTEEIGRVCALDGSRTKDQKRWASLCVMAKQGRRLIKASFFFPSFPALLFVTCCGMISMWIWSDQCEQSGSVRDVVGLNID